MNSCSMLILLSYKTENMCWERDDHLTLSNSETFRLVSNWKDAVINLRCARLEIPGVWGSHISISRLVKMLQHNMSESGHTYTLELVTFFTCCLHYNLHLRTPTIIIKYEISILILSSRVLCMWIICFLLGLQWSLYTYNNFLGL